MARLFDCYLARWLIVLDGSMAQLLSCWMTTARQFGSDASENYYTNPSIVPGVRRLSR